MKAAGSPQRTTSGGKSKWIHAELNKNHRKTRLAKDYMSISNVQILSWSTECCRDERHLLEGICEGRLTEVNKDPEVTFWSMTEPWIWPVSVFLWSLTNMKPWTIRALPTTTTFTKPLKAGRVLQSVLQICCMLYTRAYSGYNWGCGWWQPRNWTFKASTHRSMQTWCNSGYIKSVPANLVQ